MAIAALVSLPFLPLVAWCQKRKKQLLAERMTKQNRSMLWADFVRAAEGKHGTLIVEGDPRKGPNLWWTADNIRAVSPYPCSDSLGTFFERSYKPFRKWCRERYTNPVTGTALLVLGGSGQRRGFSIGSEEDERGTGIFENMSTVLITHRGK
jgi:hypothetical protein